MLVSSLHTDQAMSEEKKSQPAIPSITLPKEGGAIRGIREKFAANPVTGKSPMTASIALSQGRSAFRGFKSRYSTTPVPATALLGLALHLSIPSITRTDTTGTVNIYEKADKNKNGVNVDTLVKNPILGNLLSGALNKIALPSAITDAKHPPITLYFESNWIKGLWPAVTWGKS